MKHSDEHLPKNFWLHGQLVQFVLLFGNPDLIMAKRGPKSFGRLGQRQRVAGAKRPKFYTHAETLFRLKLIEGFVPEERTKRTERTEEQKDTEGYQYIRLCSVLHT